jgi:flagellar biosynthetic protein FlhB
MADEVDDDSKTEEPTQKRILDAIEKGDVPLSREASIIATILVTLLFCGLLLKNGAIDLTMVLERIIDNASEIELNNSADAIELFAFILKLAGRFLITMLIALTVGVLVANFAQKAPHLAFDKILPDWSRISIRKGMKRTFGIDGVTHFLKSLFKFFAVALVALLLLQYEKDTFINAMYLDPRALPQQILSMVTRLLSAVAVATVLLVGADFLWTRVRWTQQMRMTRQEIKDEMKQTSGDPLVKARLRSLALDRLRRSMIAAVPRATMVVANPTHYAIALRYVREEGGAPMVLAKGQDLIALKIRKIAEDNGIPVIEDKALARSLYESVQVDQMIPPEFYRAVAELIHFLQTKGSARKAII